MCNGDATGPSSGFAGCVRVFDPVSNMVIGPGSRRKVVAQALPVYAIAALLLVASVGPVTRGIRDASLDDFQELDNPRPLDEFVFLKQVRPYLPPLVVEWLIVKKSLNLPADGDFRIDDDGRVVVIWPDGCEEDYTTYRGESKCDPTPPCERDDADPASCDPCAGIDPANPPADAPSECLETPPIECEDGQTLGTADDGSDACVPDPQCDLPEDHPDRPETCPPPPEPPRPTCPDGSVQAYDDSCILIAPTLLRSSSFTSIGADRNLRLELKVDYTNLSVVVRYDGLTAPDFSVSLAYTNNDQLCWISPGGQIVCTIQDQQAFASPSRQIYHNAGDANLPRGNLTLSIDYTPNQTGDSSLRVELYGTPADAKANA